MRAFARTTQYGTDSASCCMTDPSFRSGVTRPAKRNQEGKIEQLAEFGSSAELSPARGVIHVAQRESAGRSSSFLLRSPVMGDINCSCCGYAAATGLGRTGVSSIPRLVCRGPYCVGPDGPCRGQALDTSSYL